jgi:hypothetical protein
MKPRQAKLWASANRASYFGLLAGASFGAVLWVTFILHRPTGEPDQTKAGEIPRTEAKPSPLRMGIGATNEGAVVIKTYGESPDSRIEAQP